MCALTPAKPANFSYVRVQVNDPNRCISLPLQQETRKLSYRKDDRAMRGWMP